ncbi:kinetochore protein Nuf2 [Callorhinchus milii]|uniref:kinetochore protein Nuf2 n=1 Tax=Callorhinchus milii TaxID=7868 RepID=UPI001C3FA73C|nr:kinetochore protein Nuf2 [Callorhinchus milii]
MEMENRLTFPNYKVDSIVEFFRSSVLTGSEVNSLTKNDLVPIAKAEVVQRLYLRSLQAVFDARVESFYMLPGDENMPYLQLSEGFAPIMNLYVSMQRFMPMCQLPNFEMSDLMNPKTKRTIHILSGIMNFLKFRKRVLENYLEQQNGFKVNAEMMQHMLSTNEDMKRKIEKLTTIPDDQRAEIQELSACITELHQTLNHDYCNEQNSVQEATAQLKAEIAESNKKLSQLKVDLTSAKGSKAKLKMQIVECPEQLKKEWKK